MDEMQCNTCGYVFDDNGSDTCQNCGSDQLGPYESGIDETASDSVEPSNEERWDA